MDRPTRLETLVTLGPPEVVVPLKPSWGALNEVIPVKLLFPPPGLSRLIDPLTAPWAVLNRVLPAFAAWVIRNRLLLRSWLMPPGAVTVKVPLPRIVLPPSKLRGAEAVWLTTTALGPLLCKTMPFPAVLPKWLLGLFRRIGKLPALKKATP